MKRCALEDFGHEEGRNNASNTIKPFKNMFLYAAVHCTLWNIERWWNMNTDINTTFILADTFCVIRLIKMRNETIGAPKLSKKMKNWPQKIVAFQENPDLFECNCHLFDAIKIDQVVGCFELCFAIRFHCNCHLFFHYCSFNAYYPLWDTAYIYIFSIWFILLLCI